MVPIRLRSVLIFIFFATDLHGLSRIFTFLPLVVCKSFHNLDIRHSLFDIRYSIPPSHHLTFSPSHLLTFFFSSVFLRVRPWLKLIFHKFKFIFTQFMVFNFYKGRSIQKVNREKRSNPQWRKLVRNLQFCSSLLQNSLNL